MRTPTPDSSPYVTPAELRRGEIEFFRLGTHPKYPAITFTPETADQWIANAARFGMPTLVLGDHDDYVTARPIQAMRRVRQSLVADCGTQPRFAADVIRAGLVPAVSLQTVPDASRLEHIAFLWGAQPGVPGMLPTHMTFSATAPPPMPRPAFRFDDGTGEDSMGGGYDALCAETPDAVVVVPAPPGPVDVAGEIAAEDRQSFVDRVMGKVWDVANRFRGNVALSPEEQFARAQDAMRQGAALVGGPPRADAAGDGAQFSEGDESMKPEDLQALGGLITAALQPVADKVTALEAQVVAFSTQTASDAQRTAQKLADARAQRAVSFSESLLASGKVEDSKAAQVFGALHLALQGTSVAFTQGEQAADYDGAEMLEAALKLRDPVLQFGRLTLAPATPAPASLSFSDQAKGIQAVQDAYAAKGTPISNADAAHRYAQGERVA